MPKSDTFKYSTSSGGGVYDWSVSTNWSQGATPSPESVIVNAGPAGSVTLDDINTLTITSLTIGSGGVVEINGTNSLTISGNLSGPGELDLLGSSTVSVGGSAPLSSTSNIVFGGQSETLSLTGLAGSGTDSGTVSGFAAGDQIDFQTFTTMATPVYNANTHTLTVSGTVSGGGSATYTFANFTAAAGTTVVANYDGHGGYSVDATCFASGTRLLTDAGERRVEDLSEGDRVITLDGGSQVALPITWVGRLRVNLARHPFPETAAPIRIRHGAFAENVPHRDLLLSPEHCVFVDGRLIAAKCLVNGMTIVQELDRPSVEYFHIETAPHAVVLAEGLPTETYLDTGNRAFFGNAGPAMMLHPEFQVNASLRCWESDACAPLAVDPAVLEPVWQRLAGRAAALGYRQDEPATTTEPALRLMVDGREIRPIAVDSRRAVFVLPRGASEATLLSRFGSPADRAPYLNDHRRLGVRVSHIVLREAGEDRVIPADHPALARGWHPVERSGAEVWRWTNGRAAISLEGVSGPAVLELHLSDTTIYRLEEQAAQRLAA